jgi:hypothetical protein
MKKIFVCVLGFLIFSVLFSEFLLNRELPVLASDEQMNAIIVFRDETLNDLARLLKPMKISGVFTSDAVGKDIYLQDAVYIGATNGRAKLITIWVSKEISDSTTFLPSDVGAKSIQSVADNLSKDKLSNTTFAIIPVEMDWKDWTLSISRSGTAVVRGKDTVGFQTVISTSPTLISKVETQSINIPIGYNQEKKTSMQPWFETDQIIIEIKPEGSKLVSASQPKVDEFDGKTGILAGTGFLNNIYFNDFKERIFNIGKNDSTSQLKNLTIASNLGRVSVTGSIIVPQPSSVRFQAFFEGDDLKFTGITPSEINCGNLNSIQCLQLKLKYKAGALGVTNQYKNTVLRNEQTQTLGNFYIGSKALNGTAKIDKIQAADGKLLIFGKVRLNGGHDK